MSARNSQTPRPVRTNTRPALNNGFNTAYGSRGVADLGAQIATGRAEEAHTHFQKRVTRSSASQSVAQSVLREPTPVVQPAFREPTPVVEETFARSTVSPRLHTAQDLNAGYDASLSLVQEKAQEKARPRAPSTVPSASSYEEEIVQEEEEVEPSAFSVFIHTLPRYLPQLFQDAEQTVFQMLKSLALTLFIISSIIIAIMTLICWIPFPNSIAPYRDQFYHGLKVSIGAAEPLYDWENHRLLRGTAINITDQNFMGRAEIEATLAANNQMQQDDIRRFRNDFRTEVNSFEQRVLSEARTMAGHNQIGSRISTGAFASMVQNAYRVLHEVNYFSLGNGAIVDPTLTSKTANPNKAWIPWIYTHMALTSAPLNPPVTALMAWQEGTECWCAEHSIGPMSKAQLAVSMPQKIVPQAIVIEHVPPQGTNDIGAAPETFVVWAQVEDEAEAINMRALMTYELWDTSNLSPEERCGEAPTREKNWVCILANSFNIRPNTENMVQKFDMWAAVKAGVMTDKIVLRVTENWGADHTCLYRVRLTSATDNVRSGGIHPTLR